MAGRLLTKERWERADAAFREALGKPAAEREDFVRTVCADDPALAEEVLQLLYWDAQGDTAPVSDAIGFGAAVTASEQPAEGMVLGPWRVGREIGRGGMSVVYLGARIDGAYEKQVAIKLIRHGMDTEAVMQRLQRERRILAALDHPYIARLLDGGATPDGRPWIVMEFVDGLPIHRYCDQHGLGVRERCRLMAKVCDAVSYAHRHLLIHRDLKPANILITAEGIPKLLDFGIAKLLAGENEEEPLTRGPLGPLTPEYASPEQRRGEALASGTDVFSLGVICYELVTGARPPTETEKASAFALRNGRDRKWAQQLQGDLEVILLMALREEPERRYLSVSAFQSDLEAWLAGQPVSAREDTLFYRAGKFVSRHRVATAAVAIGAISLMAGSAVAIQKAREAERARLVAEDRLGQIVGLSNESLVDVSRQLEQMPGTMEARRELVGSIIAMLERQRRGAGANAGLHIVLARAYLRLSSLQGGPDGVNLRDLAGAEQSLRAGLDLIGDTPDRDAEKAALWLDLRTRLGIMLNAENNSSEALPLLEATLRTFDSLPETAKNARETGRLHELLLLTLARSSHSNRTLALHYANECLMASRQLLAHDPGNPDLKMDLSVAHTEMGFNLWAGGEGDPEQAIGHYLESLRLREELARDYPANEQYRRNLMLQYEHVAGLEGGPLTKNRGRTEVARGYMLKAKSLGEQLAADPKNTSAQLEFGGLLIRLGLLDVPASGAEESLRELRRGMELVGADPYVDQTFALFGHYYAGEHLITLGRATEARQEYQAAVQVAQTMLTKNPGNKAAAQIADEARTKIR